MLQQIFAGTVTENRRHAAK